MAIPEAPAGEVGALSRLAWSELVRAIGGIAGVQNAVTRRVFGMPGPIGAPVRVVNDAITEGVHAGLRGGTALGLVPASATTSAVCRPVGERTAERRCQAE